MWLKKWMKMRQRERHMTKRNRGEERERDGKEGLKWIKWEQNKPSKYSALLRLAPWVTSLPYTASHLSTPHRTTSTRVTLSPLVNGYSPKNLRAHQWSDILNAKIPSNTLSTACKLPSSAPSNIQFCVHTSLLARPTSRFLRYLSFLLAKKSFFSFSHLRAHVRVRRFVCACCRVTDRSHSQHSCTDPGIIEACAHFGWHACYVEPTCA